LAEKSDHPLVQAMAETFGAVAYRADPPAG
jgi:hypothetical protein